MQNNNYRHLQNILLATIATIDAAMLCGGIGVVPVENGWLIGFSTGLLAFLFMTFIGDDDEETQTYLFHIGLIVGFSTMLMTACAIIGLTIFY